jgi:nitroimidazol reductase NimA-like FMN-containing flavoprotein (pyridoxamine 5'-phosphate oxidase superfamily)
MNGVLQDRAILGILEANVTGRLGYTDGTKIYVVPISYLLYDDRYIIAHSRQGQKIDILRKHPEVCLQVDEIDDLDNWRSVLVWGRYQEITATRDKHYALDLLIRRINRHKLKAEPSATEVPLTEDSTLLPEREKEVVYRIEITEQSGRFQNMQTG